MGELNDVARRARPTWAQPLGAMLLLAGAVAFLGYCGTPSVQRCSSLQDDARASRVVALATVPSALMLALGARLVWLRFCCTILTLMGTVLLIVALVLGSAFGTLDLLGESAVCLSIFAGLTDCIRSMCCLSSRTLRAVQRKVAELHRRHLSRGIIFELRRTVSRADSFALVV